MGSPGKEFCSEEFKVAGGSVIRKDVRNSMCEQGSDIYCQDGVDTEKKSEAHGRYQNEHGAGMTGIPLGFYLSVKMKSFWNDFDSGERHALPTSGIGKSDSIKRITPNVLSFLLKKKVGMSYKLIDCRYSYEYEGGHIIGALNISTVEQIKKFCMSSSTVALIFHCEFSSVRAPFLSRVLRNLDRTHNVYPNLRFPEVYILEGGYKAFFGEYPEWCVPRSYVKMHSKAHKKEFLMEEALRRNCKNKKI